MNHEHDDQEREALRWLEAAFPPGARLDDRRRADTWRLVLAAARANRPDVGVRDATFAWLTLGLVLMAAWLVLRVDASAAPVSSLSLSAVTVVVLANLACLPVAALVIVWRRRICHDQRHMPTSLEAIGR